MQKVLCLSILLTLLLPITNFAHALCVEAPVANLRKGPGTNYNISWQVFKYMPFKKLDKKDDWYKVEDLDGDVHWIYAKLVTEKFDCAVVKVDEANVRSGPGLNFEETSISPVIKYESFMVKERKDSWVQVIDEFDNTGWIFRKLLWIY